MKSCFALAVFLGLLLLPFGSLSAAVPDLAAIMADDATISPVSVVGRSQDKTPVLPYFAFPQAGKSFNSSNTMIVVYYMGYPLWDADFDLDSFEEWIMFAVAEPYGGAIAMEIGWAPYQFVGRDPDDLSIFVFAYVLEWFIPAAGGVPFMVPPGEARVYDVMAYGGYYRPPFASVPVDLTFLTKLNPGYIPHQPIEDGKAIPAVDQQGDEASWGQVKALYR
ncbi:MAG: hypothetical protein IH621_00850 [Krumholzibacteria bacterium]|nr:hypothetical protein [Candidatus Krumholzibacteria bacterium]